MGGAVPADDAQRQVDAAGQGRHAFGTGPVATTHYYRRSQRSVVGLNADHATVFYQNAKMAVTVVLSRIGASEARAKPKHASWADIRLVGGRCWW